MNALELSRALKNHKRRALPATRRRQPRRHGVTGRPRTVSPQVTEQQVFDYYRRHINGESIIAIADGNEAIRVMLCREFKRRGLTPIRHSRKRELRSSAEC